MKRIRTVVAVALCSAAFVATAQTGAPNDAQIAAIVVTANQVDIDAGKLAEAKAASKDVKAFGKQMVTDHTGVNKSATDLAAKLKLKPEDNPTAQSLKKGGADNVAHLKTLKGAAFDKAYVDHEVDYHQAVIDALDKTLIPNAQTMRSLGDLAPSTLALMHGSSFQGDGKQALYDLAAGYEALTA